MATEIEVKVLDICSATIEAKIKNLGAVLKGNWLMETIIFDYEDGRLLKNNSYVRIRSEGEHVKCTYKSPKTIIANYQQPKIMNEHEVVVSSIEEMKNILLGLGLVVVMHFEKKRKHYVKNSIVFDIDTLPNIPTYLEIEACSLDEINNTLKMLDIPVEKANSMGPREVLAHYGLDIDKIFEMKF